MGTMTNTNAASDLPNVEKLNVGNDKSTFNPKSTTKSEPKRYIFNEQDMEHFRCSPAKKNLLSFATALGQSCLNNAKISSYSLSEKNSADDLSYKYDPRSPLKGLNPGMASLHGSLRAMAELWLTDDYFPPNTSSRARFGNPMFRSWYNHLTETDCSTDIINEILDCHLEYYDIYHTLSLSTSNEEFIMKTEILEKCSKRGYNAAAKLRNNKVREDQSPSSRKSKEKNKNDPKRQHLLINLLPYFHASFGHPTRLDYGTGHESSFLIFLFLLYQIGPMVGTISVGASSNANTIMKLPLNNKKKKKFAPVALSIFTQYLQVTRGIQTDYMLEPAGSHGVWGLDDYHCLPFYFGACQLVNDLNDDDDANCELPSSIHDKQLLESQASKKMYFGCIQYIKSLKKGVPFGESSPMLNDISYLKSWEQVSKGLMKLYEGEVLNKLPVVQHFVFGDFFPGECWKDYETCL